MTDEVHRSAVTGQFVTEEEAEANPDQTVTEARGYEKRKFYVSRWDAAADERHRDCKYFVLDITDDPHALPALRAYAESVRDTNPNLAGDLDELVVQASWTQE